MQFVVRRGDLLKELQYVQGVVEKKTTVPILSNILLETFSELDAAASASKGRQAASAG